MHRVIFNGKNALAERAPILVKVLRSRRTAAILFAQTLNLPMVIYPAMIRHMVTDGGSKRTI